MSSYCSSSSSSSSSESLALASSTILEDSAARVRSLLRDFRRRTNFLLDCAARNSVGQVFGGGRPTSEIPESQRHEKSLASCQQRLAFFVVYARSPRASTGSLTTLSVPCLTHHPALCDKYVRTRRISSRRRSTSSSQRSARANDFAHSTRRPICDRSRL